MKALTIRQPWAICHAGTLDAEKGGGAVVSEDQEIRRLRALVKSLARHVGGYPMSVDVYGSDDGALAIVVCAPLAADEETLARLVAQTFQTMMSGDKEK